MAHLSLVYFSTAPATTLRFLTCLFSDRKKCQIVQAERIRTQQRNRRGQTKFSNLIPILKTFDRGFIYFDLISERFYSKTLVSLLFVGRRILMRAQYLQRSQRYYNKMDGSSYGSLDQSSLHRAL